MTLEPLICNHDVRRKGDDADDAGEEIHVGFNGSRRDADWQKHGRDVIC